MSLLKEKKLWYNIAGGISLILVLVFLTRFFLSWYTNHGDKIQVPALYGLETQEAAAMLDEMGLRYEILDSLFDPGKPRNTVLAQIPDTGEFVKGNRVIYLTVNSSETPQVKMPDLIDKNIRQAKIILESLGLQIGRVDTTSDIAEDAVLQQRYKGREVRPDTKVDQGSIIDLVIGDGKLAAPDPGAGPLDGETVEIPDLTGMSLPEAQDILEAYGLRLGEVKMEGKLKDKNQGQVTKQQPEAASGLTITRGSVIHVTVK